MPIRRVVHLALLSCWLVAGNVTGAPAAGRPADPLLALVPADVGLTLVVEDLRAEAKLLLDSPLAKEFRALPAVEAWMESGGRRRYQRARAQIEVALGTSLETFRDELLGDAVVLALRPAPDDSPDDARGLFLTRVRKPELLTAVLTRLNTLETAGGELKALDAASHRGVAYKLRRFAPDAKPTEAYVVLAGSTFAWSNSEPLIREVIDRHLEGAEQSLAAAPGFRAVRAALPKPAVASLYVDPRFLEQSMEPASPAEEPGDPVEQLLDRYIDAVRYAGAALVVRDGIVLHTNEQVEPSGLDAPLRDWAGGASFDDGRLLARMPADAPVRSAGHVDARALFDLVLGMVPEADRPRIEPSLALARGLLLGRDLVAEILPALGPGMVAYVDAPERSGRHGGGWPPPIVVAASVAGDSGEPLGAHAALGNALRAFLALLTFDSPPGALRVETREPRRGVRVTELVGSPVPLSYAVGPGFLVVGTSAESVALFADDSAASTEAPSGFTRLRAEHASGATTFAYADLDAVVQLASVHGDALTERIARDQAAAEEEVRRDLDRALALLGLFRAAYYAQSIAADFTSVDRRLGLVTAPAPPTAP